MSTTKIQLPIDAHLAEIACALNDSSCVIIEAPPGTGKTTRVAPALLREDLREIASRGKIVLLQPRRLAARAAAARIAAEHGTRLGGHIGYQVRFDSRVTQQTQLICMTPGILLRRLQTDSVLEDISVVVLDEFHERSVEYDLLMGMLRRIQTQLRENLKLVVMSATLDADSILEYLPDAPRISVVANAFPVRLEHARFVNPVAGRSSGPVRRIVDQTTAAILKAAATDEGDILVFLPGAGEIKQVGERIAVDAERQQWQVLPLYGDMRPEDQDRVLAPSVRRKIILSTNIAETSLTIDGVRVVIDCGWARVQRIDPALGLNRLMLEPISQASATQRAGRAGRTAPGVCFRLWDEITGRSRARQLDPEVLRVDLSGAALQLLCWGEDDLRAFPWVTQPHPESIDNALRTLEVIGAVEAGKATPLGRTLLRFPVHPRLASLLVEGHRLGIPRAAAVAAAILSERDVVDREQSSRNDTSGATHPCDVTARVLAIDRVGPNAMRLNPSAVRQVRRVAEQLQRMVLDELGPCDEQPLDDQLSRGLLVAFPDRLALRRSAGSDRGVLVGGRGVRLETRSGLDQAELFLCLDIDARGSEARVRMASAVQLEWLSGKWRTLKDERFFNPTLGSVVTRRRDYWFDLMLSEAPMETPCDGLTAQLLATAASNCFFEKLLPAKDKALRSWLQRVRWLAAAMPEADLPSFDSNSLAVMLENWCFGLRGLDELKNLPWGSLLPTVLSSQQKRLLDEHAPEAVTLPAGRRVLLQYEAGKPPVLAARIQEYFGWKESPRIAGGRVKLVLHMLAPNGRCHQITDDLASFWSNTYATVRKELRGRYPKHAWPEDPHIK